MVPPQKNPVKWFLGGVGSQLKEMRRNKGSLWKVMRPRALQLVT